MFANGITTGIFALLAGSQLAAAHMEISYPPPFRSKFNPHATNIDYTNTAPLADNGSNYPCKLYHQDIGTPAGASVATFAPGGHYNFTVAGAAPHNGGSCQVSLSYDNGKTFTVIKSFLGGCPREAGNYFFDIPADAPQGPAIWAWTWQNQIGNREQYMNCASVTIGGGAARREAAALKPRVAFSARPQVFLANIGNGCSTTEGTDVKYPNPGPDVEELDTSKLAPPVGNCGPVSSGSDNGSGSGNTTPEEPTTSAAQVTAAPTTTSVDLPGYVSITKSIFYVAGLGRRVVATIPPGYFESLRASASISTTPTLTPSPKPSTSKGGLTVIPIIRTSSTSKDFLTVIPIEPSTTFYKAKRPIITPNPSTSKDVLTVIPIEPSTTKEVLTVIPIEKSTTTSQTITPSTSQVLTVIPIEPSTTFYRAKPPVITPDPSPSTSQAVTSITSSTTQVRVTTITITINPPFTFQTITTSSTSSQVTPTITPSTSSTIESGPITILPIEPPRPSGCGAEITPIPGVINRPIIIPRLGRPIYV